MRAIPLQAERLSRGAVSKRLLGLAGDEKLVEEIRAGNELAFEVAFERHGGGVLSFCRHLLGSREEAEEVVQHAFGAAWSDLPRNPRPVRLKPWLYTVARNRCLSLLRARRETPAELTDGALTGGLPDDVARRSDLRALLADLRDLPEEQRAALLLTELGGHSHADVAQVLGRKEADVKAVVFRARSTLIDWRHARETPCEQIREQLSVLRGGALRRRSLRRHLQHCSGCREFREQVKAQRRMMALVLPVAPSAGLKSSVLAAVGIGGGGAGGGAAVIGGTVGTGATAVAKVAAAVLAASGGVVAGERILDRGEPGGAPPAAAAAAPEFSSDVPRLKRFSTTGAPSAGKRPRRGHDRGRTSRRRRQSSAGAVAVPALPDGAGGAMDVREEQGPDAHRKLATDRRPKAAKPERQRKPKKEQPKTGRPKKQTVPTTAKPPPALPVAPVSTPPPPASAPDDAEDDGGDHDGDDRNGHDDDRDGDDDDRDGDDDDRDHDDRDHDDSDDDDGDHHHDEDDEDDCHRGKHRRD